MRTPAPRRPRPAFTMVELLIVISIVVVTIAVLLPTLSATRLRASQTYCVNNLRQIALSTMAYASDNRGLIPPHWREENGCDFWYRLQCNQTVYASDNFGKRVGIGRLVDQRYLGDATVMYCPGATPGGGFALEDNAMPFAPTPASEYSTSYNYNPHWRPKTPGAPHGPVTVAWPANPALPRYTKLSTYPPTDVLVCDLIDTAQTVSHADPKHNRATWNLAYADGRVVSQPSGLLYRTLAPQPARYSWRRFDDDLYALETGDPDRRDPIPLYSVHSHDEYR